MEAYSGFAKVYDLFMDNIPYEEWTEYVKELLLLRHGTSPKAFVHTYGCQGNVADSERIKGQLSMMGYTMTEEKEDADLILYNTCAIREHA